MVDELRPYLTGWRGYFGFCQTPRVLGKSGLVDTPTTRLFFGGSGRGPNRFAELRHRGVRKFHAAHRRLADGIVAYVSTPGSSTPCEPRLRLPRSARLLPPNQNAAEPPWYGPVCPVVWEGRCREAPPYPDGLRPRAGHTTNVRFLVSLFQSGSSQLHPAQTANCGRISRVACRADLSVPLKSLTHTAAA